MGRDTTTSLPIGVDVYNKKINMINIVEKYAHWSLPGTNAQMATCMSICI